MNLKKEFWLKNRRISELIKNNAYIYIFIIILTLTIGIVFSFFVNHPQNSQKPQELEPQQIYLQFFKQNHPDMDCKKYSDTKIVCEYVGTQLKSNQKLISLLECIQQNTTVYCASNLLQEIGKITNNTNYSTTNS